LDHMVDGISLYGLSPNGQKLWMNAENRDLLPGRTWQALEGRYKKYLRKNWVDVLVKHSRWARSRT